MSALLLSDPQLDIGRRARSENSHVDKPAFGRPIETRRWSGIVRSNLVRASIGTLTMAGSITAAVPVHATWQLHEVDARKKGIERYWHTSDPSLPEMMLEALDIGALADASEEWRSQRADNSAYHASSDLSAKWERAFIELDMLIDDEDFVAPPQAVIDDLEYLSGALPADVQFPAIEHDSSSGHVTLSWFNPGVGATFSISVLGGRKLFGAYINPRTRQSRPFRNLSLDGRAISDVFDDPMVREALGFGERAA